jgi:2-succinyl-6-hydroxy-2,4-cyclohexadiene-1-carboxylate synthase
MHAWDGLAVAAAGTGPSVLWLHGYTMRSQVWEPLWARLPGWRHLGLDLPWHGSSRDLRDGEDLAALADTVVAHARRHGVQHVVALSFGTVLASEMAIRHPDAIACWLLAAPALTGMPHEPSVAQRYRDLATMYADRGPGPHLTDLWMTTPPAIFAGVNARPPVRKRVRALVDRHQWRELATDGMRPLVSGIQDPAELAAIDGELHVAVGELDLLCHRACARSLQLQAGARIHRMPSCGHLPLLEDPVGAAELVEGLLRPLVSR